MKLAAFERTLVVQLAGLGEKLLRQFTKADKLCGLAFHPIQPVFPAVTCTAQAALRTALPAAKHGIVCNGWFRRDDAKVEFWNQSAYHLPNTRIWDSFKRKGGTVGTLFTQQSLGDPSVDLILSPAPIHKHAGGIIQDCYSKPAGLYETLCKRLGRQFNLFRYWGPFASIKATRWIADATLAILQDRNLAPDLLFTYLPHMDYVLQKGGPDDYDGVKKAFDELLVELAKLVEGARDAGCRVLLCSDYAIEPAQRAVFPNRILSEAGYFQGRKVKGRIYPDLYAAPAFAVCDHQVAHVYIRQAELIPRVADLLSNAPGVEAVLGHNRMDHPNAGELILVAEPDAWFAYPWWIDAGNAPDYAGHVDIHNKIGFDPCELFLGSWFSPRVSQDTSRVGGSHGRNDQPVFFATTVEWDEQPRTYLEMAQCLGDDLDRQVQ